MKRQGRRVHEGFGGVTTNGDESNDNPPMNPKVKLSIMSPMAYISIPTPI
jgi:hypothetical protein